MKPLPKITGPLALAVVLSLLWHLAVWSGLSGAGFALLAGLGRLTREEVVNVLIADPPPALAPAPAPVVPLPVPPPAAEPVREPVPPVPAAVPVAPVLGHVSSVVVPPPTAQAPEPPPAVAAAPRPALVAPPPPDIIPFARERLTFSLQWSGINVGTATMEAVKGEGSATIKVLVRSNAFISAFYPVEEQVLARLVNGRPVSYSLRKSEGKRRGDNETLFDTDRDKVVYINHLNKERTEHEMKGRLLWDVISAFYYLRRQPLPDGQAVKIAMFDSNKFLNTEVRVVRRERAEDPDGRDVPAVVVEPLLNSEGLFQRSGEIYIWLTDDERRLPLRMETKLKIGRVTAELREVTRE